MVQGKADQIAPGFYGDPTRNLPEHALWRAVVCDGVTNAMWRKERHLKCGVIYERWVHNKWDLEWVQSDEIHFNSFRSLCEIVGFNAEWIRKKIKEIPPGWYDGERKLGTQEEIRGWKGGKGARIYGRCGEKKDDPKQWIKDLISIRLRRKREAKEVHGPASGDSLRSGDAVGGELQLSSQPRPEVSAVEPIGSIEVWNSDVRHKRQPAEVFCPKGLRGLRGLPLG